MGRARLLGHHPEAGSLQYGQSRGVSRQIGPVLTVTGAGQSPVAQVAKGDRDRVRRGVEYFDQGPVVHGATIPEGAHGR